MIANFYCGPSGIFENIFIYMVSGRAIFYIDGVHRPFVGGAVFDIFEKISVENITIAICNLYSAVIKILYTRKFTTDFVKKASSDRNS